MNELKQPTAVTAAKTEPPHGAPCPVCPDRPQLRMSSVEYAALVLSLAPRELRVIECLVLGMRNGAMGRHMGRSPKTVKSHLRDVTRRTGMTRLSLAVMGYRLLGQY